MKKQMVCTIAAAFATACFAAQDPIWLSAPGSTPVFTRMAQTRPDGQSGPVTGKPFSATEVHSSQQVLGDGTHVNHTDTSKFYRDAQGRMRSGTDTSVLIFDPVANVIYTLNAHEKTYKKEVMRT